MRLKRSLDYYLFTVLIFSLVYCCISFNPVNAEIELPPIPVDTDYDTDVDSDGLDFYNFITEYGRDDCSATPSCWFDFNLDGNVDDIDLESFGTDFGRAGVDAYESDDTSEQARVVVLNDEKSQHHNFHQYGDEDWMRFFALSEETYKIETNLSDICVNTLEDDCDIVLELYNSDGIRQIKQDTPGDPNWNETIEWTCPKDEDGVYFVKVYLYEPSIFGTAANYFFRIYQPTAPFPGTIFGTVRNAVTKTPIPYALIRTTAGGSAISFPNGVFISAQHPAGSWQLTATAAGYSPYTAPVSVTEFGILRINIEMAP